jgi:thiol-disulfide isomerase/thioredoxin
VVFFGAMKRETKFLLGGLAAGLVTGVVLTLLALAVATVLYRQARTTARQGEGARDFALQDVNPRSPTHGRTVRLSEAWSDGGVVVNFMASWCAPCRKELPALESIHGSGDARILCVAADEGNGTEDLLSLVAASGISIPVLYAPPEQAEELARAYTHEVLPSTYLIGPDGRIRERITGARPEAAFRRAIAEKLRR